MKSTGIIKFFNETKGFGFIVDDETKKDIFVHATGLIDKAKQGDRVCYIIEAGKKGDNAVQVELV